MRPEIRDLILNLLRERGPMTTVQITAAIGSSGLPASQHRYPAVRNSYLEPMQQAGVIRLVHEESAGDGGALWALAAGTD